MQSFFQHQRIQKRLQADGGRVSNEVHFENTMSSNSHQSDTRQTRTHTLPEQTRNTDKEAERIVLRLNPADADLDPLQWPTRRKLLVLGLVISIAFMVGWASSIDSAVVPQASQDFGVSDVAGSLDTALFLVGFGVGAPFAGPLSETFGRTPVYITTFALFCAWILGAALASNLGAQLAFRFLAGVCGSTPFTTAGGTLGDIFDHSTRGRIFPLFALFAIMGPMIAPMIGGYIGVSGMSWRWADWITLIISGFLLILLVLFLPETYAPVLLTWKAQILRTLTGDKNIRAPLESTELSFFRRVRQALIRPLIILITEPIVVLFTLYLTFVYMVIFSFLSSYPFIFGEIHNFSQGSTFLMFLGIICGLIICTLVTPLFGRLVSWEVKKAKSNGHDHAAPEAMLWWAIIAAPMLPMALFWMAWSSYPTVSYWSPLLASVFIGFALLSISISTYAYLIQTFTVHAASALVGITFVRFFASGAMVVVSIPMYRNLGVRHSLTILAAISCGFTPVPWLFYHYGERIRGRSRVVGNHGLNNKV